jgi:hypothetical protein
MDWSLLVSSVVATALDTQDVEALLHDFLPSNQYYRFNPLLEVNLAIDEKNKALLSQLKQTAKNFFNQLMNGPDKNRIQNLIQILKKSSNVKNSIITK